MKRFIAVLCAAVMTVATCVTPFAAISGKEPAALGDKTVTVDTANCDQAVADAVLQKAEEGIFVEAVPVVAGDYADSSIVKAILDVFASKDGTTAKILAAAKVTDDTITTLSGRKIKKSALSAIGQFLKLQFSDGDTLPDGKIRITLTPSEAMKGKDLVMMQVDTKKDSVIFADVESSESTVVVDLPSTNPILPFSVEK
jgi:hypothetical protein